MTLKCPRIDIKRKNFSFVYVACSKCFVHKIKTPLKLFCHSSHFPGWGQTRFDSGRPVSMPPQTDNVSVTTRMSAESSSESEASVNKGSSSKDRDKKGGVFRIFSKKKSKSPSQ